MPKTKGIILKWLSAIFLSEQMHSFSFNTSSSTKQRPMQENLCDCSLEKKPQKKTNNAAERLSQTQVGLGSSWNLTLLQRLLTAVALSQASVAEMPSSACQN